LGYIWGEFFCKLIRSHWFQAKEIVVNYTSNVDLSSAQAALGNAINGTIAAVENAGSALTEAIVNAKLDLHNVIS
jgi:hypothetical protein